MKVTKDEFSITIQFESADWTSTLAQRAIELIKKTMPQKYIYSGITKKWRITQRDKDFEEALDALDEAYGTKNRVSLDDGQLEIEEFMKQFD